jgi:hypothetical protein
VTLFGYVNLTVVEHNVMTFADLTSNGYSLLKILTQYSLSLCRLNIRSYFNFEENVSAPGAINLAEICSTLYIR